MKTSRRQIKVDPDDFESLCNLMDKYGDATEMYFGENIYGEATTIHINSDHIIVETFQDNGWIRINTYYRNRDSEEIYER